MRKAVLIAVALLATSVLAQQAPSNNTPSTDTTGAQRQHHRFHGSSVDAQLSRFTQRYNLTSEQQQKLRPILEQQQQQADAIRKDTSLTPEQKQQQIKQLRQSTHTQLETILTPEQKESRATTRGKGEQHHLDQISRELNLTDDQKEKVQPILEEQQKQVRAVHQDTSLSPDQKKAKVRGIRQQAHKQILTILTPEQQQQLRQMHRKRGQHGGPGR